MKTCLICGHDQSLHTGHIAPDHIGQKINHVNCRFIVKRSEIDLKEIGINSIGHNCSCDGVKPNRSLKQAIKKYQKYIKENKQTMNAYRLKELRAIIRRFKNDIKENPKNLLWWQIEQSRSKDQEIKEPEKKLWVDTLTTDEVIF